MVIKLILKKQTILEVKKSKFLAFLYEINSLDEVNIILDTLRKEHKKAKHFPYAYKIDLNMKKTDDKEPSGTAGLPILNIILKNNLNNTLIIVIRYFGGIKLGAGGLLRTYSNAASSLLKD